MHFTPHIAVPRACWHCRHFLALVYQGTAARCALPPRIRAMPDRGCAFWEREVGADDEPGPPVTAMQPTGQMHQGEPEPQVVAWAP
jgi:hypothetical protein